MKEALKNQYIVDAILAGGRALNQAMADLYKSGHFKDAVRALVLEYGGKDSEVEDVFQDGIAHLIMNIRKGNFRGESGLKTYFLSICKNIWFQKLRREKKFKEIIQQLPPQEIADSTPGSLLLLGEKKILLNQLLDRIGSVCKKVISLWTLSYSMKEIAQKTGYKNEGVVRKKKHQCLQALVELVKDNQALVQQLRNQSHG